MSTWALIQIVFNIFMALGLFLVIMRMSRAPKDDPRLSRGLQLLQSKISVLEDLSDRTETQVGQLTAILEQKAREVQAKVQLAEQHVHAIRVSMDRSLEVAKIFQDKIPHQEIIERQNTLKYVQAARLAHQGANVEQIAQQVDLPMGEIEFIAKVNRDRLMFNEEQLPWWAKSGADPERLQQRQDTMDKQNESTSSSQAMQGSPQTPVLIYPQPEFAQLFGMGNQGVSITESSAQENLADSFNLPHHQFDHEMNGTAAMGTAAAEVPMPAAAPPLTPEQDNANRLKAEVELAEHQRLVENLSRLQFEMQNLDIQLAKENSTRNLSQAFEAAPPPANSLQRLGDEFRKACEEANEKNAPRTTGFTPLDQLGSLIPKSLFATDEPMQNQAVAPSQMERAPEKPAERVIDKKEIVDPVLARAAAQAKVQAALRIGAKSMAKTQAQILASPDHLEAARAMAKDAAVEPASSANQATMSPLTAANEPQPSRIINGRSKSQLEPVIRRVEFPRIN